MNYTLKNDYGWPSKKEFEDFKDYMFKKKRLLLNTDYNFYWDGCSNWVEIKKYLGRIDGHRVILIASAKVFQDKSTYGINNGRISKMSIRLQGDYPNQMAYRKFLFTYDRGDDTNKLEEDKEAKKMYKMMMAYFN